MSSSLARDQIGFHQLLVAGQIAPGVGQRRLILRQLPLCLGQLDLEWPGIDFRQQIAGFHLLPFGEVQGHQLAVDPAGDGNGIGGGDGAQPDQIARHGLLRGRGHLNRRQIAAAFATGGRSFGTAGRGGLPPVFQRPAARR